jgi:hypothetical protein
MAQALGLVMSRRRWVMLDGELVEVSRAYVQVRDARSSHNVMPDIQPYRSMIDGREITSRSRHREHLRAHGCIEVGNDPSIMNPVYKPLQSPPGLKETLIRVAQEKLR